MGNESDGEQHQRFKSEHDLTPVEFIVILITLADALGGEDAHRKRSDGHKVIKAAPIVAPGQTQPHQHDVAGLRIGENSAAAQVGVGVQKTADNGEQCTNQKRFGYVFAACHGKIPLCQPRKAAKRLVA
ncbi:hypothetical protein SDC9_144079 [bioreactor metagenome]|uniref:Uncharacterized protein n=1 Tax=bioreactor metagenome TaxID=1076179 RepID=A0A645E8F4_9ZZZZ